VNKYQVEDTRLRTTHLRSLSCVTAESIVAATGCSLRDAWRLHLVREIASVQLIDAWLRGKLRFRSLLRLATDNPVDPHAQVAAANLPPSPNKTFDSNGPPAA
jgi:hypothetical protein